MNIRDLVIKLLSSDVTLSSGDINRLAQVRIISRDSHGIVKAEKLINIIRAGETVVIEQDDIMQAEWKAI